MLAVHLGTGVKRHPVEHVLRVLQGGVENVSVRKDRKDCHV